MKLATLTGLLVVAALSTGCHSLNRLTGVEKKDTPAAEKPHEFRVLACCRDNNAGVLTYPSFLPTEHVQACQAAETACHGADCQIGGNTVLPTSVDCGHGTKIGDEYYAGRGY